MGGAEAEFTVPARHVEKATAIAANDRPREGEREQADIQLDGAALVLEDNMIIAMDAADMLRGLGAETVHMASNVADALRILEANPVTFALLDVNLGNESSLRVAEECASSDITCVLATGYGKSGDAVKAFPQSVVLRKPYTVEHVKSALSEALE